MNAEKMFHNSIESLYHYKEDLKKELDKVKKKINNLNIVLAERYQNDARDRLADDGKDYGTVTINEDGVTEADILVHDESNKVLATLLAQMEAPNFPIAIGVLFCDPAETYETAVNDQLEFQKRQNQNPSVNELIRSGATWTVD